MVTKSVGYPRSSAVDIVFHHRFFIWSVGHKLGLIGLLLRDVYLDLVFVCAALGNYSVNFGVGSLFVGRHRLFVRGTSFYIGHICMFLNFL